MHVQIISSTVRFQSGVGEGSIVGPIFHLIAFADDISAFILAESEAELQLAVTELDQIVIYLKYFDDFMKRILPKQLTYYQCMSISSPWLLWVYLDFIYVDVTCYKYCTPAEPKSKFLQVSPIL